MEVLTQSIGWQDIIDILLLAFIIYRILILVKGTRTVPVLAGSTLVLALYILSRWLDLAAIRLLLDNLANSLVLVLVILFQSEIRNALSQFGLITFFTGGNQFKKDVIDEAIQSCISMAHNRIGALIVFERESGLRNIIEKGTQLNAMPSKELFLSIFMPTSPLHDGAVIIDRKGKVASARCILPITTNTKISPLFGTRHRAAIGLTEESDALVLVVSEERSEFSLAYKGELIRESSDQNIKKMIFDLMEIKDRKLSESQENPQKPSVEEDYEETTPETVETV